MTRLAVALLSAGVLLNGASSASNCDAAYGSTGKALASVLRDATTVLPSEVKISANQVVLIRDFDRWTECREIREKQRTWLRGNILAFTIGQDFPIYVIGENEGI